ELRQPSADPELCELLQVYAQQRSTSLAERPSVREVRDALDYNLMKGKTGLHELAAHLAMSPRSLQRAISVNGMNFRSLLDQARRKRALGLLQDQDLPITEVAARLHYSDASAFSRAFQRWTGRSPRRQRKNGA